VPLAALWVYDFKGRDASWNVTATNERAYQLWAISEANARVRANLARRRLTPRSAPGGVQRSDFIAPISLVRLSLASPNSITHFSL
jgi:hypothetical protein